MNDDGSRFALWCVDLALRTLGGLTLLFGAFLLIGTVTGEGLVFGSPAFLGRAMLFWIIVTPAVGLYIVGAIILEALRRRKAKNESAPNR